MATDAWRALIHLVLRRRGVVSRALPPVSLILATWAQEYAEALTATRYLGPAASAAARQGLNRWVGLFAAAAKRAVADADPFEDRIQLLERTWRERLGRVRANSAADLLLRKLPGAPILTVQSATELIGRSSQATNEPSLASLRPRRCRKRRLADATEPSRRLK